MGSAQTPIDTTFDVVDDLLDGLDVGDDQTARINAHLARLLADDDVLRTVRLECGIAQKAVASGLGVTASAIAQLEARSLDTVQLGTIPPLLRRPRLRAQGESGAVGVLRRGRRRSAIRNRPFMTVMLDLRVDLNTEDDTGLPWAFLRDARDPGLVREGGWLIVGFGNVRAVAQVAQVDGDLVWVRPLPGPVSQYRHLLGDRGAS